MEFLIFEDNGGGHRWTIVDGAGKSLGQSGSYASHDEAEHAARLVRDNAGARDRQAEGEGHGPDRGTCDVRLGHPTSVPR